MPKLVIPAQVTAYTPPNKDVLYENFAAIENLVNGHLSGDLIELGTIVDDNIDGEGLYGEIFEERSITTAKVTNDTFTQGKFGNLSIRSDPLKPASGAANPRVIRTIVANSHYVRSYFGQCPVDEGTSATGSEGGGNEMKISAVATLSTLIFSPYNGDSYGGYHLGCFKLNDYVEDGTIPPKTALEHIKLFPWLDTLPSGSSLSHHAAPTVIHTFNTDDDITVHFFLVCKHFSSVDTFPGGYTWEDFKDDRDDITGNINWVLFVG